MEETNETLAERTAREAGMRQSEIVQRVAAIDASQAVLRTEKAGLLVELKSVERLLGATQARAPRTPKPAAAAAAAPAAPAAASEAD